MACASCSTKDGQPKGCKNNGTCGTDSCNKLTVFDWLAICHYQTERNHLIGLRFDLRTDEKNIIKTLKI